MILLQMCNQKGKPNVKLIDTREYQFFIFIYLFDEEGISIIPI